MININVGLFRSPEREGKKKTYTRSDESVGRRRADLIKWRRRRGRDGIREGSEEKETKKKKRKRYRARNRKNEKSRRGKVGIISEKQTSSGFRANQDGVTRSLCKREM